MKALVHAELLKLRSRMALGLLIATLALTVLTAVSSVPPADGHSALSIHDPTILARLVGLSLGVAEVLMLLLGTLSVTQEFRYGTASSTFLVEPRRTRVLLAKCVALALASLPITAAASLPRCLSVCR